MTLTEVVGRFHERKVLVVGDVGLDRYIHGVCSRLCPEAPVPVFTPTQTESRAGLAGNVATNVAALGARVKLCSIIGDDQDGVDLQDALVQSGVMGVEQFICKDSSRRTTMKTRYVSDWHLMLRVDEEQTEAFEKRLMDNFISGVVQEARAWADVIVVQDYAKGLITQELMSELVHCAYIRSKPLIVDPSPKQNPNIYQGVSYLKPNHKEAMTMANKLGLDTEHKLLTHLKLKGLLVTMGAQGMVTHGPERGQFKEIPAQRKEVHDVCGAGDTVTAVFALGLASGCDLEESARMANSAASVVVGKFGTSTLSQQELLESSYG